MADKSLQALTSAIVLMAEDTHKHIQPDVKDIRDAVCGSIAESLLNIEKSLAGVLGGGKGAKKGDITKISTGVQSSSDSTDKYGQKIVKSTHSIESILKQILQKISKNDMGRGTGHVGRASTMDNASFSRDMEKKSRNLKDMAGMSKAIDLTERLRNIKLKDLLFVKKKLKTIGKVLTKFRKMFSQFKSNEEAQQTISFAESTIGMMKSLAKVALFSKLAKMGAKAIEKIILGGKRRKGLLAVLREMGENKDVQKGIEAAKMLKAACTSLFIASLMLVGIAVVGIPAMLGALLLRGVIWLLTKTFKLLTKATTSVLKGSLVLLIMSSSVILFALGLGLMVRAVRNMEWKDVGLILASIVGIGLAVAGVGLLAIPIAIGSLVMLMIGVSLGLFAVTMLIWRKLDVKEAMGNIKLAVEGLREVFGLELGKGDEKKSFGARIGGGLMDLAMAILNFGKAFFIMGALLLAGVSLGILYMGIKQWSKFHDAPEAIKNIKVAVSGLREIFGLQDPNQEDEGFGSKLKSIGGGILDLAITVLQAGKALIQIGIITLAVGLSVLIRESLKGWAKFDPKDAITNLRTAIVGLKEIFGFEEKTGIDKIGGFFGGLLDIGVALVQAGEALIQVGVITILTGMSVLIRESLKGWATFDPKDAIGNLRTAIFGLKEIFGFEEKTGIDKIGGLFGGLLDIGIALVQAGQALVQVGVITIVTGMSVLILKALKKWQDFDPSASLHNLGSAISGLKNIFGIKEKKGFLGKLGGFFGGLMDIGVALVQSGKTLIEMGTLAIAAGMSVKILQALQQWAKARDLRTATRNLEYAIDDLKDVFGLNQDDEEDSFWGKLKKLGGGLIDNGLAMMNSAKVLREMGTITVAAGMSMKIREALESWRSYPKHATSNLSDAISRLKTVFGLDDEEDEDYSVIDFFAGDLFQVGASMMKQQGVLQKMGTIAVAVGMMGNMRKDLQEWEYYKEEKAISNIESAVNKLLNVFGLGPLKEKQNQPAEKQYGWLGRNLGGFGRFLEDAGGAILNGAKKVTNAVGSVVNGALQRVVTRAVGSAQLSKLEIIASAIEILGPLRTKLQEWEYFNPNNAIRNLAAASSGVMSIVTYVAENDVVLGRDWTGIYNKYASEQFSFASKEIKKGLGYLVEGLKNLQNVDKSDVAPLQVAVKTVNALDVMKATVMTELFKSFAKIGSNPLDKFIRAVNRFSDSCDELIEHFDNGFTEGEETTNEITMSGQGPYSDNIPVSRRGGGGNSELAAAIAQALRNAPIYARTDISDVRLVVNNESGRRVILSLDA